MGTWRTPLKNEDMDRLEMVMATPIPAVREFEMIGTLIGDDTCGDTVLKATRLDPQTDVRSIILTTLHEWVNLMPEENWSKPREEGVADRMEKLLQQGVLSISGDDVIHRLVTFDEKHANSAVADVLGIKENSAEIARRLTVREAKLSSVFVVEDTDGAIYNFDSIWGVVTEVPDELRERYLSNTLPDVPAPRM